MVRWRSRVRQIRRTITTVQIAAAIILLEQVAEAVFLGVSLAEHPALVIACLGALGFPKPSEGERESA